jgi:hypothetical protein
MGEQVVSAYPEMWPDGVAKMLDAIDTLTLQELYDERTLQELKDSVHISQLLEAEERRLRNITPPSLHRFWPSRFAVGSCGECGRAKDSSVHAIVEIRRERDIRAAREGRDGDPFAGFPRDGQP